MSYIRGGSIYLYVEGKSKDYIFPSRYEDKDFVEDYGKISNDTIVELIARNLDDSLFKDYIIKKLAEKLKVKLREKPLTHDEVIDMMKEK